MRTDKGLYVVMEGIDGAGKTTQIPRLRDHLEAQGFKVVLVREPYDTPIAAKLFDYVLGAHSLEDYTRALLMMACRYDIHYKKVRPALEEGCIVLSDRSYLSMLAYQLLYDVADSSNQIRNLAALSAYVVRPPDRTFLFDLPVSIALSRCDSPPFVPPGKTAVSYLEEVRDAYKRMAVDGMIPNLCLIDGLSNADSVFKSLKTLTDVTIDQYRAKLTPVTVA